MIFLTPVDIKSTASVLVWHPRQDHWTPRRVSSMPDTPAGPAAFLPGGRPPCRQLWPGTAA